MKLTITVEYPDDLQITAARLGGIIEWCYVQRHNQQVAELPQMKVTYHGKTINVRAEKQDFDAHPNTAE